MDAAERLLAAEAIRSERRRNTVLAGVLSVVVVLLLVLARIPGIMDPALQAATRAAQPRVLPLIVGAAIYQLFLRRRCQRLLLANRKPSTAFQYLNTFAETSIPTLFMVLALGPLTSAQLLISAIPMVYFLFVFVTTLQLNARLCLFSGVVAGAQFAAVALWMLPGVQSAEGTELVTAVTAPHQYVVKGAFLAIAGAVAGFVASQIKSQFIATLRAMNERDRAVRIFGQHVSPEVAAKLLKQSAEPTGELRTVCVMFLDVRDFTRLSTRKTPEELMEYLNTLFSGMIDTINEHQGIVNKFLGDGLMAVFGAPLDDAQRCQHALDAALKIIDDIEDMNKRGIIPPTRIGIGLHMGDAVTGNVGSARRKEYTIIGSVVNLASRIEQATKQFDGRLLVSESVWNALDRDDLSPEDLGLVTLKGLMQPVRILKLA